MALSTLSLGICLTRQVVAGEVGVIGSELLEPLLVFVEYSSAITTSILKRLDFLQGMCFGLRDINLGIKRNIITKTNIYCQYNERRKSLNDQKVENYFLPFRIRPEIGASLDQV